MSGGRLFIVNTEPVLMTFLDVCVASLPSYDVAVAASNRRSQLQQLSQVMKSEPVVLTDSHAKTDLLSGGNTIVMVPQVRCRSIIVIIIIEASVLLLLSASLYFSKRGAY